MTDFKTRTASLVLAFGSFFVLVSACSTFLSSVDTEEANLAYEEERYLDALDKTNRMLEEEPENGELLLLKARTLDRLASDLDRPGDRADYYREMLQTIETLNESDRHPSDSTEELIAGSWQREHSAGSSLAEQMDGWDSDTAARAFDHFENALLINPDAADTYALKASLHYRGGELGQAMETLETPLERFRQPPAGLLEKQAYLQMESGAPERAIELYKRLLENDPGHIDARHGLVNAYILVEDHENSIRELRELVELEPEEPAYRHALAAELSFLLRRSFRRLSESAPQEENPEDAYRLILEQLTEAETHFQSALELHPDPDEITYATAAFYKNMANYLSQSAEETDGSMKAELVETAEQLLQRSLPVWQEVADRNPENPDIWRSMYQIYTELDMQEEAENARSRVN